MDYLRSCYVHDRRLFRGQPKALTRGRYFFAPDGAPDFPAPHCFGSYFWTRDKENPEPAIGEVVTQPRPFYDGDPPEILPVPRICGPIEYFTKGDPNGPRVGLTACLNAPPNTTLSLPSRITHAHGVYVEFEGALQLFERQPTDVEKWSATFPGTESIKLTFICTDDIPRPPGEHYALSQEEPEAEAFGWNRPDSWDTPFRLVFDAASELGSFRLTVGNLPSLTEFKVWGIPQCCLNQTVPQQPTRVEHFDPENNAVLYLLAAILASTYEATPATAQAIAGAWLGTPIAEHWTPNTSAIYPGTYAARYPGFGIAFCPGTTNFLQLALQGMNLTDGPVDYGAYGTNPTWRNASRILHTRLLSAGIDETTPVVLVGHSYGGALAWLLATDYRVATPTRPLRCFTYGCPKPGDDRLATINAPFGFTRVENYGDPVPAVAPDLFWLSVMFPVAGLPQTHAWARWKHGGESWQINADGTRDRTATPPAFFTSMVAIAANWLAVDPLLDFTAHGSATYAHRLSIAAGNPANQFPVSAAALAAARAAYP